MTTDCEESRKRKLIGSVAEIGTRLPWQDKSKLQDLLCEHHSVFALEDGERGETGMIQMEIDTGNAEPKRQLARRTPFAGRQEIACRSQIEPLQWIPTVYMNRRNRIMMTSVNNRQQSR